MGTFLDNPVAKSRHAAQNSFRDILKRYFSAITTDKTTEGLLGETLDSLTDLDTNKKSKVSQKAWSKTIALDMSNYKYSNEALVEMADSLINTVQNLKLDPNHINQGWLNLIGFEFKKDEFDLDVPVKLIPTYRNSPTPELDLDEAGQVNQAFLEKHWDSMDAELREQILEYAVHAEGLINEGHNITHLIPSKVFKRYLDKMSKVNTEEVMTEQFMDNIVREGRASVKEVVGIEIDTAAPNTLSGLSLENKPSKYFKVVQDGDEYIYKTTGKPTFDSSTKKWVADANLLVSPNDIVRVANRDIVQYSINDNNKPAADFSPISADEIHTQEQNQRASVGEDVSNQLEMMFPSDNDVDLQIPVESRNENASKVNKRLLRRLSNKFNIPFKVINDPDFKVAGFYDAATNTVVINEAYAKADTPIHEFAHPFIKSIKSRNPELYNSLIAQLNSSEEGRAALDRVQELYAQNTLEQQQEEALVQLLGELAADKLTNKTLIEQLTELFNQIKNIVKGLFGAQADIIQEKMNADMTLGELADIVIDSSKSVDIDTQMDDRFRRAIDYAARSVERLEKMFNPAVAVVKASELMSSDIQAEHSKIKALGFLSNNNYVVKRKGVANENVDVLSFRVPIKDITVWKDKMASIYPEFKITEKSNAPVNGFDMYEVSIGGDSNAYIYVPKNNRAFHPGSIAHANIDFQMAAGSTKSSKRVNNNSDVFGGLGFDLDEFEVSDLEFGNSGQERNRLVKGFWNDVLIELNLDDDKISPAMRAVLVRDVIAKAKKQASDNFDKVAKKGKLSGSLKDVVYMKDIEQSQVNSPDNWIEYFKYGTINATADQEFVNAVQSFERMLEVTMFLDANSDYLIKDGKRVSSSKVAKDIIDRSNNASSQRADFFEKFPVVGKLYSTITKTLSGLRNFTLNMFTPEVMANVVTGDEKNFLHQLVNDDMIDADAKDAKFKQEVMDGFRERLPKEMQSQVSKFSDWLSADPKDAKTIAIKGLSSKVPVGKALSLYLALRQSDVKAKLTNPKTGEVNVALFDEVTQKEKKATVNAEKFMAQFETQMANNPELGALVGAIDGTMTEIHDRVNPAVKNFIGVDLGKVANYFPIRYGSRSGLKVDSEKRRIEDFTGIKERSLDNMGGIRMDDAFQMIDSYVNQASKFNAYAEPISNLRKVIQEIERQGDESHEGTVAYIYDMIDNIQDYRQLQSLSDASWDKKIRQGMNNFTLAVLGWNPAVALKQVVSIVAAAPELGLSVVKSKEGRATAMRILKTSYKDSKIGKGQIGQLNLNDDTLKEIMDLDPLMRERFQGYIDRDQGEYRSSGMNPFSKEGKKTTIFGKKMDMSKTMEMIKIHDAAAIAWIFEDIKSKNPGISKDALRKKLRQTVMRTQPTYNVSSRTNLSRSNNPLMRLFTMFSSQRAKNMNMMVDSIVKYATNPDERSKQNMKATLLAIGVLSSIGIAVIDKFKYLLFGGGGDDEDALDIAADIGAMSMLNTLGNIYFVGQFSQMVDANIRNKPFGKSVEHPVFQTVGIAAKGVADLTKGDVFKAADGAIQTGMRVMGAPLWPYTNIVRKGAKAIGSEDGSGKSSKSSESNTPKKEQGEVMTATERAAQLSARTQLIKADMAGKRAVMELVAKREAMESRERIAAMRARTALAIEAAKDRRAESKEEK
jgi:predicted heme/steroid binding protein